jgi:integrase
VNRQILKSLGKKLRGMPKGRRYANDRAPTLEEIQRLTEYPDRRIKPIIYTMVSSGIRLGAWDYLNGNTFTQ